MSAWRLAIGCLVLLACSGPGGDADLETLRHDLASEPRDPQAHRRLGLALASRGFPGGALRHLSVAERNQALAPAERRRLGALYLDSAVVRLDLMDAGAMADLERARSLGVDVPDATEAQAWSAVALASARARDRLGMMEALAALQRLDPDDPRPSLLEPEKAEVEALGRAALWLHRGGARALALEQLEIYLDRGGRQRVALDAWVEEKRWWGAKTIEAAHTAALIDAGIDPDAVTLSERADPIQVDDVSPTAYLQWQVLSAAIGGDLAAEARALGAQRIQPDDAVVALAVDASDRRNLGLEPGLARVARAFRRDPALAHRLARELADRQASIGVAAPALAELFHQLGDQARALEWMRSAHASSTGHPPYLVGLAAANAYADDPAEADVHLIFASERAGDSGWVNLEGGRTLARAGHSVAALIALRRALSLTGPSAQEPVLRWIERANQDLGRDEGAPTAVDSSAPARELLAALQRDLPARDLVAAAAGDRGIQVLAEHRYPLVRLAPSLRRAALR